MLNRYQLKQSIIHQLDPRVKIIITVLFIISNVLLPDGVWVAFVLAWGLVLGINTLAKLPLAKLLKTSLIAFPFALAAITVVFTLKGTVLSSFYIGTWQINIYDTGLIRFISILLRSWLSVQMAILLTNTTQFADLMHALRHLHIPQVIVAIISFAYRYLFVLVDEVQRLLRARDSRSAASLTYKSGGLVTWRAKVAGNMVGQLFLRSYERSDRVYNAMLARGYQGHFETINPHIMHPKDWVGLGIGVLCLFVVQVLGWQ